MTLYTLSLETKYVTDQMIRPYTLWVILRKLLDVRLAGLINGLLSIIPQFRE